MAGAERKRGARAVPWAGWRARAGVGLLLAACGGSSADPLNSTGDEGPVVVPPWACVPGETQACDCPGELDGIRTCNGEGAAFGECDCSPGAVSQGPPLTSTGSDSGTASDSGTDTATTTAGAETSTGPGGTTEPDPTTRGSSSSGPGGGGSSSGSTG